MVEKPILFSGEMVRAILAGRKCQTRRIVKGSEDCRELKIVRERRGALYREVKKTFCRGWTGSGTTMQSIDFTPKVQPGDTLWVREAWQEYAAHDATCIVVYRADGQGRVQYRDHGGEGDPVRVGDVATDHDLPMCWRPSIHMPRWACRLRLNVTGVRVERLQDITRGDAMAEGCPFPNMANGPDPREWFADLWQRINGVDAWDANPWVWVYRFKREQQP